METSDHVYNGIQGLPFTKRDLPDLLQHDRHMVPALAWNDFLRWKELHRTTSENLDEIFRDHGSSEETPEVAGKVGQVLGSKESWAPYAESIFQKSRPVLYGPLFQEGSSSTEDTTRPGKSQRLKERAEYFADLRSRQELKGFIFNTKHVLDLVGSRSTSAEFLNFSVSEKFRARLLDAMKSRNWEEVESMVMPIAAALPRRAAVYEAFILLASLLLSVVFQYLISLVDKGGTKTHSSGSLELRSRYISVVLFLGAYIWIKFREVAPPSLQKPSKGIHRKSKVNGSGVKEYFGTYEPRFKPPGSGNYISVGSYEEEQDAKIVYQILAFYFGREVPGVLPLLDGSSYFIPLMTEEEKRLDPKDWAKDKAKAVFEEYKWMKSFFNLPLNSQEVQAVGDISNTLPPDAGAGCGYQSFQLDNQSGGLVPPNVDPGMQDHVADDSCSDHPAGGAGVGDEPPVEPQIQRHDLEENRVNNVNPDDVDIRRVVEGLLRDQQRHQLQIQQLETQVQQQGSQIQQQGSQIQQLETRISGFERHRQLQDLHMQQQESRFSVLEGEVELLRSREPARKRICVGVSLRHDSQN